MAMGEPPVPVPAHTENVHGTAIAVAGYAALLRGPPGCGKSDLALRCLALPPGPLVPAAPTLVADDRTVVTAGADGLSATCPPAIAGLIEVRGIGIVEVPVVVEARLVLVVDLVSPSAIERLPPACEPAILCGRSLCRVLLTPFEASAPLKLVLAISRAANAGRDRHLTPLLQQLASVDDRRSNKR